MRSTLSLLFRFNNADFVISVLMQPDISGVFEPMTCIHLFT